MTRTRLSLVAIVGLVSLLYTTSALRAQVAPTLGTARQFGVLGKSAVTGSTGSGTAVTGDVGSFPTPAITNFPPSTVVAPFTLHLSANATVQQAQTDAKTAYDFLAGQGGSALPGPLAADELGGRTIGPGVYSLGAGNLAASTTLTLNGSGIFIFNVASTLTMNVSSVVAGTADPCSVFWRVGTSATLNGTNFFGTVIADASITLGGGTVTGRLLAGTGATGAVTMPGSGGNTIGGCSVALVPPTISKAFSPASMAAGGVSRLTITLSNSNASAITLTAAFTDTLPSGVVVAPTPGVSTTCGGSASATAGGSTVTLASGSTIPAGSCTVAVNVTALAGSFLNTIAAGALQTSTGNNAAPATATLTATCPVITLAPATLPNGTVGVAYIQTILGSGGTAPYVFTLTSGTLPAGVTLTSAGVVAGTPTTAATSTFTIRGTDANGCFASVAYTVIIAPAPPVPPVCPTITLAPPTLPNGTVGVAYTQTIVGSGGTAPYVFGVTAGALPTALTLTPAGLLSGTPTTAGTSTFTIRGTDANGCFGSTAYTLIIAAAPVPPVCPTLTFDPLIVPNGIVGIAYSRTITLIGGTAPYSFGVISGALPAGLTLTAAGVLSGTPTVNGTSAFTIRGTDALGCFAERVFVSTINLAVPTLPEVFVILLILGLIWLGDRQLRRRAATLALAALVAAPLLGGCALTPEAAPTPAATAPAAQPASAALIAEGRQAFRFNTFGDEPLWTDKLRLHDVVEKLVDPTTALKVGLKVDADVLPPGILSKVDLKSPATTVALLKMNAIVGLQATVDANNHITRIGVTCALCHSTVDNSVMAGIGRRQDGWPNRDLNVGAIIALSPVLSAAQKAVYNAWGPGKYDPRYNQDGRSTPLLLPPAYGLAGIKNATYTADGSLSYWNAYVAVTQMGGQGNFSDPRLGIAVTHAPDLVTPKLAALGAYQHSLTSPPPPAGSFDAAIAERGRVLFDRTCATCHVGGSGTDNNTGKLHAASETGVDPAYAARTATKAYRTTPLRALWQHPPYFHDGSAATLGDVVAHYNRVRTLGFTPEQQRDLVEYLKSR